MKNKCKVCGCDIRIYDTCPTCNADKEIKKFRKTILGRITAWLAKKSL